jgi:hypothetical protein
MVSRPEERQAALEAAITALGTTQPIDQYLLYADAFFAWIVRPETVAFQVVVRIYTKGKLSATYETGGGTFMTAMTMDDTATVAITPEDDHGDVTADAITWTFSDNGTVFSTAIAADTHSVTLTPIAEGSAVSVTATDPTSPSLAAFSATFDVGPGATSQLVGAVTVNTGANAAA